MPSENQRKLEKFTAEKIISLCGEAYQFARLGDNRREPDVILKGTDVLGIEVTLGYYQGDQDDPTFYAHEIWNFVENPTFDAHGVHRIVDPRTGKRKVLDPAIYLSDRLLARCQAAIDDKCSKTYQGIERTWLGIYVYALLTESYELDKIAKRLVIPSVNPFERILLLHRVSSQYRVVQIFPLMAFYVENPG